MCQNGTEYCQSEEEGTPVTKLGEVCEEGDICNIENAECIQERCKCIEGYVGSQSGRKCLSSKDDIWSTTLWFSVTLFSESEMGEACNEHGQCVSDTNLSSTMCKDGKCQVCGVDEHVVGKTCYKTICE